MLGMESIEGMQIEYIDVSPLPMIDQHRSGGLRRVSGRRGSVSAEDSRS